MELTNNEDGKATPRTLLGRRLRRMRNDSEQSLRALAGQVGYPHTYLGRVELGDQLPAEALAIALDAHFGTSGLFVDLLELAQDASIPDYGRAVVSSEEQATRSSGLRKCSTRLDRRRFLTRPPSTHGAKAATAMETAPNASRSPMALSASSPSVTARIHTAQRWLSLQVTGRRSYPPSSATSSLPESPAYGGWGDPSARPTVWADNRRLDSSAIAPDRSIPCAAGADCTQSD